MDGDPVGVGKDTLAAVQAPPKDFSTRTSATPRLPPARLSGTHSAAPPNELQVAIARSTDWLLEQQQADGHWCAELEGDSILQSEYLLLLAWLGEENSATALKAARHLLNQQCDHGGWSLFPGGDPEISASVKAYFALKLVGEPPDSEPMQRARRTILDCGGADRVNSFTRFYLALLGQIPYSCCPAVPPEIVLLPKWSPLHLYKLSAWSRTMVVPLSVMWACRPERTVKPDQGIQELFIRDPRHWKTTRAPGMTGSNQWLSWDRFFRTTDRMLKTAERFRLTPLRPLALKKAEAWMPRRFAGSDGLGAIFPPMVWSIIALKCLGYRDDSLEVRYCREQLDALAIEDNDTIRLQPCKSPVWDTTIALRALRTAQGRTAQGRTAQGRTAQGPHQERARAERIESALYRGTEWLLSKEVSRQGDWAETTQCDPGGWYFEYHNDFYPDTDDTAMALLALSESSTGTGASSQKNAPSEITKLLNDAVSAESALDHSMATVVLETRVASLPHARRKIEQSHRSLSTQRRAVDWLLAMQNRDGGWGAFDRNNDDAWLCRVPFADHNAMIDPSTPDLAGRVLEALAGDATRSGERLQQARAAAIAYLRNTQEEDGCWFGRWGVNYIYGTWQAIVGLSAAGVPSDDPAIVRAADWLEEFQQPDGGWGESPHTYDNPGLRGSGAPSTPSQTAWAILGLVAADRSLGTAVSRGIDFLLTTQNTDGTWDEEEYTGTGFPRVFYLKYHNYRICFPLLALGTYRGKRRPRD